MACAIQPHAPCVVVQHKPAQLVLSTLRFAGLLKAPCVDRRLLAQTCLEKVHVAVHCMRKQALGCAVTRSGVRRAPPPPPHPLLSPPVPV